MKKLDGIAYLLAVGIMLLMSAVAVCAAASCMFVVSQ